MTEHLEGILFAIGFVIIVGGLAWYSRKRYRELDALERDAEAESKQPGDIEIDQTFAAKLDQQARDKGAV